VQNRRLKTPRERRRQKLAFWSLSGLLIAYAILGGDYKLYHLLFLTSEKDRVARRIDELQAENAVLGRQKQRLESDTLLLEQMAREKGMRRSGEIVYRLVPVVPERRDPPDTSTPAGEAGDSAVHRYRGGVAQW
jgi:cell division protein FtsB